MDEPSALPTGLVPIRVCRVTDGAAGARVTATVYCPPREAYLPLDACRACECASRIVVDATGRTPSSLRCTEACPTR